MDTEIKVGEYIRDGISGEIGKVIEVNPNYYRKDDGFKVWKASFKKIKHSKNIIDLIEVGDYVNGEKVVFVYNSEEDCYKLAIPEIPEIDKGSVDFTYLEELNIATVVPKEQFEEAEYTVEKEDKNYDNYKSRQ